MLCVPNVTICCRTGAVPCEPSGSGCQQKLVLQCQLKHQQQKPSIDQVEEIGCPATKPPKKNTLSVHALKTKVAAHMCMEQHLQQSCMGGHEVPLPSRHLLTFPHKETNLVSMQKECSRGLLRVMG